MGHASLYWYTLIIEIGYIIRFRYDFITLTGKVQLLGVDSLIINKVIQNNSYYQQVKYSNRKFYNHTRIAVSPSKNLVLSSVFSCITDGSK